jgi:hypothetical protein
MPWWRVFLEKLIIIQMVKKFHAFTDPEDSSACSVKPDEFRPFL